MILNILIGPFEHTLEEQKCWSNEDLNALKNILKKLKLTNIRQDPSYSFQKRQPINIKITK